MKTVKSIIVLGFVILLLVLGYTIALEYTILSLSLKFVILTAVSFPLIALSFIGIFATFKWITK